MAEDLADYLHEMGVKVSYLHSEVDTLERVQILRDLRLGIYDVLVGINLLREGIDLPEVTLVAILDADKEGFLRSAWSLIQVIGRAARNTAGEVVMYADRITESMQVAIDETDRRRTIQEAYNLEHGIEPQTIIKEIRDINDRLRAVAETPGAYGASSKDLAELSKTQIEKLVAQLEAEMRSAAKQLEFERAAAIRDEIQTIRLRVLDEDASHAPCSRPPSGRAARVAQAPPQPRLPRTGPGRPSRRSGWRPESRASGAADAHRRRPCWRSPRSRCCLPARSRGRRSTTMARATEPDADTAADWLPGLRDEHEDDDAGWMARWLDRATWDRSRDTQRHQADRRAPHGSRRPPPLTPAAGRAHQTRRARAAAVRAGAAPAQACRERAHTPAADPSLGSWTNRPTGFR